MYTGTRHAEPIFTFCIKHLSHLEVGIYVYGSNCHGLTFIHHLSDAFALVFKVMSLTNTPLKFLLVSFNV